MGTLKMRQLLVTEDQRSLDKLFADASVKRTIEGDKIYQVLDYYDHKPEIGRAHEIHLIWVHELKMQFTSLPQLKVAAHNRGFRCMPLAVALLVIEQYRLSYLGCKSLVLLHENAEVFTGNNSKDFYLTLKYAHRSSHEIITTTRARSNREIYGGSCLGFIKSAA